METEANVWQQIFIALGGQAMLVTALTYLVKSLFSQMLTKDVEKFKAELKADADGAVERLKSGLQIAAMEHQVRFSKLHDKRALVVAELYELFVTAYWAARTYHQWFVPAGGQSEEEQAKEAWEGLHKAYQFFERNRIYLSVTLAAELDTFFDRARTLTFNAQFYSSIPDKTQETAKLYRDARREGLEAFRTEFPSMRQRLDAEFKKLIDASARHEELK